MEHRGNAAILDDIFRRESASIVATLVRIIGDIDIAEEVLQETIVSAIEHWPRTGVPDNPAAWMTASAKHRAIDYLRRAQRFGSISEQLAREQALQELQAPVDEHAVIPDDRLRLMFTCCHPDLAPENGVALTLRLVGGLSTPEIARAFLVSEAAIAQRIVRAKKLIRDRHLPYIVPERSELPQRLASVLSVIYLIFNEGYASREGPSLTRVDLCSEAIRLGAVLVELMPDQSEALGLLALMEVQTSRNRARVAPSGELVQMADQDRALWDRRLIASGLDHLERAGNFGPAGAYQVQAKIAACHAVAATFGATDWRRIAALYADLSRISPSPVVELNRAIAVSMSDGPATALAIVDTLADEPTLKSYHRLPATRADFLRQLERWAEAALEYRRALALVSNDRERDFLTARLNECESREKATTP
jgi:RNA polymerase sigma factor (sigma-70 family)